MSDPGLVSDQERYRQVTKAYRELEKTIARYREYKEVARQIRDSQALMQDEEMRAMAREELQSLEQRKEALLAELRTLLLPKDPNDEQNVILEIRAGPGGQGVNTTYSAIRITHLPTGMVVQCQDERSQHKNKARAMKVLRSRLLDLEIQKQRDAIAKDRRSQVGTGERSEKIRTYNFPQNRLTDHRVNVTIHRLPEIMEGDIDPIIEPVLAHYQAEALKEEVRV